MPNTPKLNLAYPAASDAPDVPGSIYNLGQSIESALDLGGFTPNLGGTGATLGNNGAQEGNWHKVGPWFECVGRLVFGSGASFGSGAAVVQNLPLSFSTAQSVGNGFYIFADTSKNPLPLMFRAQSPTAFYINPIKDNQLPPAFTIGTPAQSDQLIFNIRGITA